MAEKITDQHLSIDHQHSRASSITRNTSPLNSSFSLPTLVRQSTIPARRPLSRSSQNSNQEKMTKSPMTITHNNITLENQSEILNSSKINTNGRNHLELQTEIKSGRPKTGTVSQQRHYLPQEVNVPISNHYKIPSMNYPIRIEPIESFENGNKVNHSSSIFKIRDPRLNRQKEQVIAQNPRNEMMNVLISERSNEVIKPARSPGTTSSNGFLQYTEMPNTSFGVESSLPHKKSNEVIETSDYPWGNSLRFGQHTLPNFQNGTSLSNQNLKWGEPLINQSKHVSEPCNPGIGQKTKKEIGSNHKISDEVMLKETPEVDPTKDEDLNTLNDLRQRVKRATQKGDFDTADKLIRIHQFLAPSSPIKSGRPRIETIDSTAKPSGLVLNPITPGPTLQNGGLSFATGVTASIELVGLTPHFHELFKKLTGKLPLTIFNKDWLRLAHEHDLSNHQSQKNDKNGKIIYRIFPYPSEWSMSFDEWESNLNYMIRIAREIYKFDFFANGLIVHRETVKEIGKQYGWITGFRYCQKVRHSVFTYKVGLEGKDTQDISVWRKDLEELARQESELADDLRFHDNPYRTGGEKEGYDFLTGKPRENQNVKVLKSSTSRSSNWSQTTQTGNGGKTKRHKLCTAPENHPYKGRSFDPNYRGPVRKTGNRDGDEDKEMGRKGSRDPSQG